MLELKREEVLKCPCCEEEQEGPAEDYALLGINLGSECEPFECQECYSWLTTRICKDSNLVLVYEV